MPNKQKSKSCKCKSKSCNCKTSGGGWYSDLKATPVGMRPVIASYPDSKPPTLGGGGNEEVQQSFVDEPTNQDSLSKSGSGVAERASNVLEKSKTGVTGMFGKTFGTKLENAQQKVEKAEKNLKNAQENLEKVKREQSTVTGGGKKKKAKQPKKKQSKKSKQKGGSSMNANAQFDCKQPNWNKSCL